MFFLCTPFGPADWIGAYVILLFLLFIYPWWYYSFENKSLKLLEKGEIREKIYNALLRERVWFWGLLGFLYLVVPSCGIPFAFLLFGFPVYFAFSFIFFLFNKEKYNKEEKNLLLLFYGIPVLVILLLGITFKIGIYRQYYGDNFLIEIFEYYVLGTGKDWFIHILGILIVVFIILYINKYLEDIGKLRKVS